MKSGYVEVRNRLGLHARAAAVLVRKAGEFQSDIKLIREEKSIFADAKSILSVLTLAASEGKRLKLEVIGEDEGEAFDAISDLFATGFGEEDQN